MANHTDKIARYLREGRAVSGGCGASASQKEISQQQQTNLNTLTQQSGQIFGAGSQVFNDLTASFAPVVAAGADQSGYSPAELQTLKSQAITQTGQQYRNASAAAGERAAAAGGGNALLPSGTQAGIQGNIAAAGANATSNALTGIDVNNAELGRQNWLQAASILGGATNVYNPATGAANAATGAGSAAMTSATDVANANNQWQTDLVQLGSSAAGAAGMAL